MNTQAETMDMTAAEMQNAETKQTYLKEIRRAAAVILLIIIGFAGIIIGDRVLLSYKAYHSQGGVFTNSAETQEYFENQLLCNQEIWSEDDEDGYDEDGYEEWHAHFTMYTKGVYDNDFIHNWDNKYYSDLDGASKADYIRLLYAIEYSSENKYGITEWTFDIYSSISPSDQAFINETAQMIADDAVGSDAEKVQIITEKVNELIPTYRVVEHNNIKTAVCDGAGCCRHYAELFYLACIDAGVNSRIVIGECDSNSVNPGHAWNLVEIDGIWYHADPTWAGDDGSWTLFGNAKAMEHRTIAEETALPDNISESDYRF